jgi:hypothetical protein
MHLKHALFLWAVAGLLSCSKQSSDDLTSTPTTSGAPSVFLVSAVPSSPVYTPPTLSSESNKILIDASRDGGVWWFPQSPSTGYNATAPHQGKALADYLRTLGFVVDELPRGTAVTDELLGKYDKVIRASAFGNYSTPELAAYEALLSRPSALLLLQDHLTHTTNDNLSQGLGLLFSGALTGAITRFASHDVTKGVTSLSYIAGSVLPNPDKTKITVLGTLSTTVDSTTSAAMGILHHPTARVLFLGDVNGLEQVPQPLTANLVKWLFQ